MPLGGATIRWSSLRARHAWREMTTIFVNKAERNLLMAAMVCFALLCVGPLFGQAAAGDRIGSLMLVLVFLVVAWRGRRRPSIALLADGRIAVLGTLRTRKLTPGAVRWEVEESLVGLFRRLVL